MNTLNASFALKNKMDIRIFTPKYYTNRSYAPHTTNATYFNLKEEL